jgi:hypothetical protein
MKCERIKNKQKETTIKKYGVDHCLKNKEVMQKLQNTNMKKYGKKSVAQVEEFKEKRKKTNMERYDNECSMKSPIVKENHKKAIYKKQGGYTYNVPELMVKVKKTMMERYDVENPMHSDEFKNKIKETNLEKYDVEYPMQNKEIMSKALSTSYKKKDYILPSGKIIQCQGYENFALDDLLQIYEEDNIINGIDVPDLWYEKNGKKRRHFVDFYIPTENKCIEIKSTFTLSQEKNNVFEKQKYAKEQGYLYEIWVYDNGKCIEIY